MRVLIIYTGGTIGMKADHITGALIPFDFGSIYDEFPTLRQLGVEVETINFEPIDSSNVSPALWIRLAETINANYDAYDGFVVLHGTDTMAYTSSALSFMLAGLRKPVVFTGSQIPIGVLRTDGRENLITAIEIAAAGRVPEVTLYFQNRLFRANRSKKTSAEEFAAFSSPNYPTLADVGVDIHYHKETIATASGNRLTINTALDSNILIIKLFPAISETFLRAMLSVEGLRGVVLETYGSGNAPTEEWFIAALREAIERNIIVVNVTQCLTGSVNMDIYDTGRHLEQIGVVSGRDITTEAATTKLMHLLGQGMEYEQLVAAMHASLRGEQS